MSISAEQVKVSLETVKKWVEENDPSSAKKANDAKLRRISREYELQKISTNKSFQDSCPHLLGSTGSYPSNPPPDWPKFDKVLGAFFGQRSVTGEVIGVCCYCRKTISSWEPEDSEYFDEDSKIQWFNLNRNSGQGSNWGDEGKSYIDYPNKVVTIDPNILTDGQLISISK